jgi:Arc/MetJ family transcription regulator
MRTNIVIDDHLMADAMAASGVRTKRAVVEEALRLFVQIKRQAEILKLRGIGWEGDLEAMRLD